MKNKVKKKTLPKKSLSLSKKSNSAKDESSETAHKKLKQVPCKVKAKKTIKSKPSTSDNSSDDSDSDRKTVCDRKPTLKKLKKSLDQKKAIDSKSNDGKEVVVVRKRMASLNASAMMAATYEAERQFDKCQDKMYKISSDVDEHISPPTKKPKEIKNEVLESKDVCIFFFIY